MAVLIYTLCLYSGILCNAYMLYAYAVIVLVYAPCLYCSSVYIWVYAYIEMVLIYVYAVLHVNV